MSERQIRRRQGRVGQQLVTRLADQRVAEIKRVVRAYADIARQVMLDRGWRVNTCIAATRVTINVLGAFGIAARPFCTSACVYSPEWVRLRNRLGREPSIEEQIAGGAWSVGLGLPDPPEGAEEINAPEEGDTGYNGHLVALVADDALLLDASIDQAARPERGIVIPPEVNFMAATPEFVEGREPIVGENNLGAVVVYRRREDPPDWEIAPDWDMHRHASVELAILRALEKKGIRP